jgi:hypothetical protein
LREIHLEKWEKERMSIDLTNLTNTTTIFLWDEDARKLTEWDCSEIFPKYGIEGFYLNELFVLNQNS